MTPRSAAIGGSHKFLIGRPEVPILAKG